MVIAKKYILKQHFSGFPKKGDLEIVEETLPPLKPGEFLAEALVFSVDPYMRAYEPTLSLDTVFIGSQVARVIESKSEKFPTGQIVVGEFGWRTHTINDGARPGAFPEAWVLPDLEDLPLSLGIGVLGMPGNTAYFGLLDLCQPKEGETIVISGAGGAVGSHVGQIAKIKGCKVIGIAGSDEKGDWLVNELGFDHFINYKKPNLAKHLKNYAPDGVDCYFDNVGGQVSSTVLSQMNLFGRIAVCGSISAYNCDENNFPIASIIQPSMVLKQLKMGGFVFHRWLDRWYEGIEQNMEWIREGKLKYHETVTIGFANLFAAFVGMLQGKNIGKAVVLM